MSRIRFNIIGIISAAVSTVIAIGVGVYSFGGFPQQLANNLPLPDNPLTPNFQNDGTDAGTDSPNIDPATISRLMAEEGLDQDTASLIAQIDTQIKSSNSTYLNYEQTLEGEGAWDVEIRAIPDQTYVPTEAELETAATIYDVSHSIEVIDGIPQFTLRYFVPYEAMSEDLKASLQSSGPGSSASAAMVGFLPAADASEGASGAVIVTIIKNLIREGAGSKFGSLFGALDAAVGVYKLKESRSYFSELDQLKKCAENPTNPLTKKTYQENPSEKAKVIDQVNEAQSQLDQLTAARMLNLAVKTGSKFAPGSQIFAVKLFYDSVAKWNDETLKEVSERWVDDARKAVVKCDPPEPSAIRLNGTIQYRVSYSEDIGTFTDSCHGYNACAIQKDQQSGSGTFFVKVMSKSNSVSGNGTGSYEQTRTRVITGTPESPLTEYNGEYSLVRSGDVVIMVEGHQFPTVRITVGGGSNMIEEGSSTQYVNDGSPKVRPVTEQIHRETSGGFVCHFEGVDLVNGGKYKEDIIWGEAVVGSCEIELFPG
jgi:hypothetical protein